MIKKQEFMNVSLAPFWVKFVGVGIWVSAAILGIIGMAGLNSPVIIGLLLIGLYCFIVSREKPENGRIKQLRYESLFLSFMLLVSTVMSIVMVFAIFQPQETLGLTAFSLPALFTGAFYLACFYGKIWLSRDTKEFSEEEV